MNSNVNKNPSLLEGLDIPDKSKGKGKSSSGRRDVATAAASRTTSLDWTPKQKKIAAFALAGVAVVALGFGGVTLVRMRPLELPKTFDEAKVAMETDKFKNMDQVRQDQYKTEAGRLLAEKMKGLTDEQRRAFVRNDENREVMQQIQEQRMDEMAKKLARGEKIEFGPGGPGGFGGPGRGPGGGGPGNPPSAAALASFQPRAGDDPPSPPPRTNENRRDWGGPQGGPNQGGPNQGGPGGPNNQPGGPNTPGNQNNGNKPAGTPAQGTPAQGTPAQGTPGSGGGGNAPAAGGGGGSGGGGAGGGGGGRRMSPTSRMANRIQKGNAQSNGLRFEAMQKMMANGPRPGDGQNPGIRVLFTSGSAELNELAFTTMAPIIKQLTDQPETSVRIWGLVDPKTDGVKLRHAALRNSFAVKLFGTGAKGEQLTKDQLEQQMIVAYNEMLASKAAAENKPAPALVGPNSEVAAPPVATMEEALVEAASNPPDLLIVLAQQRQDAIKKYLVEKHSFNEVRVRTVGVAPQFMEQDRCSAVLQVGK